jgi:hypothetical protein
VKAGANIAMSIVIREVVGDSGRNRESKVVAVASIVIRLQCNRVDEMLPPSGKLLKVPAMGWFERFCKTV